MSKNKTHEKVLRTDKEWCDQLNPEEYEILRKKGTEQPFTGKYLKYHKEGKYICAGCGQDLFDSDAKYKSGSGWPSFWAPISDKIIYERPDHSLGLDRTEILCNHCGGHLGHLFRDGPEPTGLRYCVNSIALDFKAKPSKIAMKKPPA